MPTHMYRVPEKMKFKRLKTDHQQPQQQQQNVSTDSQQQPQQQQNVSTDPQQQQQQPQQQQSPSYLVSNEMNQFLQVSGEIEEMIGCFSRPNTTSLQIPDLERYRTIMEPNTLEYFKDKFDKIIQEYHLAMNEMSICTF
ncbi:hypothetical protein CEXT_768101 [Caerostris extrusa]|uniref:Uncharacterized protein n=1 Tax=Caerostris extrusa TaxID=172846 RepID=A0AAV4NW94_CAEEX|nr:hypothetical protein CEXT_768101 [Caerostris extrusa]